jgi:phenylacetate-CoA ligase
MPGKRFKIVGRADDMLIVKGVNVYPGAIKSAVEHFFPLVTGALRIMLDKPGPSVNPPLKIRLEYGEGLDRLKIRALESSMIEYFKENLRITPKLIWVEPGSIPREIKKTNLVEVK